MTATATARDTDRHLARAHAMRDMRAGSAWSCSCSACVTWMAWPRRGRFWLEHGETGPLIGDAADGHVRVVRTPSMARRDIQLAHAYVARWGDIDLADFPTSELTVPAWHHQSQYPT